MSEDSLVGGAAPLLFSIASEYMLFDFFDNLSALTLGNAARGARGVDGDSGFVRVDVDTVVAPPPHFHSYAAADNCRAAVFCTAAEFRLCATGGRC